VKRCERDRKDRAYTSEYTRGLERVVPPRAIPQAEFLNQRHVQSNARSSETLIGALSDLPGYPLDSTVNSDQAEFDSQEFISSSGGSIFDRTQDRLDGKVSQHQKSSIFMFGDPPLPEFDGSFFFLPPPEVARTMVGKYFDIIAATVRFLHRPTVELRMES
jgi:hypothetical protein